MAAIYKVTRIQVIRDFSPTDHPHLASCYYFDPTEPSDNRKQANILCTDGDVEDSNNLQSALDSAVNAVSGNTVDWTL